MYLTYLNPNELSFKVDLDQQSQYSNKDNEVKTQLNQY